MKQIIASVYDSKVGVWSFPQGFVNKGALVRAWETVCNDGQSPFCLHPTDFAMFIIGEWSDEDCSIRTLPAPEPIGVAIQFKRQPTIQEATLNQ